MANTLTFTPQGTNADPLTVTPIPGTVTYGAGSDDRGGGNVGTARAGLAKSGSCQVELDDSIVTQANLVKLFNESCSDASDDPAPVGIGDTNVTGAGDYSAYTAYGCTIDILIGGDSVQIATITWNGRDAA